MSRFWLISLVVLALALLAAPGVLEAQGLLVVVDPGHSVRLPRPWIYPPPYPPYPPVHPPMPRPEPPPLATYKIQELDVQARLLDQVAQVRVSQSFVNTGSRPLEVSFIFPLPYDGAIDQLTLMVDGKEFPAKLLKAEEARRLYEDIVRKNKDPALLEWMGTGLFRTSVFPVPPGEKRTVSLRYSQICRKQEGLTDFLFPLSTAKYTSHAVEAVNVRVTIDSALDIKNVYSPTHVIEIKRPDDRHATVTWTAKNTVPGTDFRLFYDVGRGKVSTRVLSYRPGKDGDRDGYFLLLASPQIKSPESDPPKKTVVFVIDRSGSMSGKKIEQVRSALKFVLGNLRQGDLFNVIAYDSEVEAFRPELQRFDDATRKAALGFAEGLYAGGSTNIDAALRTALGQLQDSSRPSYVMFLTDGLPTTGQTNEAKIAAGAKESNRVRARVFAFGVGYDVNSRLLDTLARDNHGYSEFVRPDEDIEDRVSRLYRRIQAPVLTDVKIEFSLDEQRAEQGGATNRVYPKGTIDLFAGDQLVLVGRYRSPGNAKVKVTGSVAGQAQKFDFPARLVERSPDDTNAFVEKLWAVRRVGEILDELDVRGKNEELVRELVDLATRHGIITPYTSFLADENTRLGDLAGNARLAEQRLNALSLSSGEAGFMQRGFRGQLQRAQVAESAASRAAADFYGVPPAGYPGMAPGAPPPGSMAGRAEGLAKRAGPARGGGMGGYGGMPGMGAPAASGAGVAGPGSQARAAEEMEVAQQSVRNVGNRAFYFRANQWVDSTVSKDQERQAIRLKQFSDRYFELARRHGRSLSQYLVFDEPVLLNLEGQAYLIEP